MLYLHRRHEHEYTRTKNTIQYNKIIFCLFVFQRKRRRTTGRSKCIFVLILVYPKRILPKLFFLNYNLNWVLEKSLWKVTEYCLEVFNGNAPRSWLPKPSVCHWLIMWAIKWNLPKSAQIIANTNNTGKSHSDDLILCSVPASPCLLFGFARFTCQSVSSLLFSCLLFLCDGMTQGHQVGPRSCRAQVQQAQGLASRRLRKGAKRVAGTLGAVVYLFSCV